MKTAEVNINRVYLMMGFSCNFKCKYCLQVGKCETPVGVSQKVYDYLDHLIAIRTKKQPKLTLFFWGGEPLVYKDIIRQVVARYGDKLDYSIVTNGGLLDDEFVEYAYSTDIAVVLSHDGENTELTRGKDMLKDDAFLSRFRRLKKKGLLGVLSAYNYDYMKNVGGEFEYNEEMLKVTWDMPSDIYSIPLQEWEEKLEAMADKALADMLSVTDSPEARYFADDVNKVLAYALGENGESIPNCRQMYTVMNINLLGDVLVCHNSDIKIGTVDDDRMELIARYEKWLNDNVCDECRNCHCWYLCKGGCPLEKEHKGKTCVLRKIYYGVVERLAQRYIGSLSSVELGDEYEY